MISPLILLGIAAIYFGVLAVVGVWAERRAASGRDPTRNGWMYALALTVYCSSWTFYGSVGSAAHNGMLFTAIYLGPTLMMLVAWGFLRRLVKLRHEYNFSSVADLVTLRYGKSVRLGAVITGVMLLGMLPYIGLQIRALLESFTILTGLRHSFETLSAGHYADELMVLMVAVVTILFGLRRADTRRRQSGLIAVLAVESVTKLGAFLAVGAFVTWGLFDGFGDLQDKAGEHLDIVLRYQSAFGGGNYLLWMNYLVLSMGAIVLLPRMFHVMVVENINERHLTTAMWLLPLYLLLISVFVLPIAVAGQILDYPLQEADWLVLRLPFDHGEKWLSVLVYLGGLASAVGMVMVACTTMAIMFSNHIVLPLLATRPTWRFSGNAVLYLRWLIVFVLILAAYAFQRGLQDNYFLIQMGLISFASVAQFIPALIGALYWRRASARGAWCGLLAGWALWFYTLFLPAAVRGGLGDRTWLIEGPGGIVWLRPEQLFGLNLDHALVHGVFWSLLVNVIGFVAGSAWRPDEDNEITERYLGRAGLDTAGAPVDTDASIDLAHVLTQAMALVVRYLPAAEAEATLTALLRTVNLHDHHGAISAGQFVALSRALELALAGVVGAALARQVVATGIELSEDERASLQHSYAEALADLRITPAELRERIDHFKAMNDLSLRHAEELQSQVDARTQQLADTLAQVRDSEQTIKSITQSAQDAVVMLDPAGCVSFWNPAAERIFGWRAGDAMGRRLETFLIPEALRAAHVAGLARFQAGEAQLGVGNKTELVALTHDGREIPVEISLSATTLHGGLHAVGVLRDITDRRAAEAAMKSKVVELQALNQKLEAAQSQLLQSEKMASIGQLAAGVAHEINNPVGFVNSNLGTLKTYCQQLFDLLDAYERHAAPPPDSAARDALEGARQRCEVDYLREDLPVLLKESEDGLRRVKRIVQDLKNFSHVDEAEWQFADLNEGIESTLNVVWNEVKYKATVDKHYGSLPPVRCLAAQLNQVFMNLIVNAVHAIDSSQGLGVITLSSGVVGDEVWVEVRDSGRGMSEDVKRRVFEPFFTTKPVGKGTGLGLSLSFGIVQKHQGRIDIDTEPGVGTAFRVWLPVAGPAASPPAMAGGEDRQ